MAKKQQPVQADAETLQVQYPAIEELVDSENFEGINARFTKAYAELEALSQEGGMGKSRQAKKIMRSMELTMDLLSEILKLKYKLTKWQEEEAQKQKK